jgi:hypothetical protein
MAAGGTILAAVGGFTMHLLPGRVLLIIAGIGGVVQMIMFALMPSGGGNGPRTFWGFVFPAMVASTVGVDIAYNVSNVFITTNVPRRRQGVAGAVIYTLLFLGISFFLGFADVVAAENAWRGTEDSYRAVFWFGTGVAGVALVLFSLIRIGSAKSEMLVEEKEELQRERQEAASLTD